MADIDELYQATIVEHDRAPRHHGPLAGATHAASVDNPLCGDVVTLQVRMSGGAVAEAGFEARGCALSRAAASILCTMVPGATAEDVRRLTSQFEQLVHGAPDAAIDAAILDELGELRAFAGVRRFRSRRICALLPFRALQQALDSVPRSA